MQRNQWSLLALLAMASWSASAAEESGLYVGAGIGEAQSRNVDDGLNDKDTAYKSFAGFTFNRYFATELAYLDGGTFEEFAGNSSLRIENTGFIASLVGTAPVTDWFSLFAKAGYAVYDSEVSLVAGNTHITFKDDDENFAYGVGTALHFGRFGVRFEYEAVNADEGEYEVLFASAVFKF